MPKTLTKQETEKTKRYSIIDGSANNVMFGFGEQYVSAYAIKLGATGSEVGVLSSVPTFLGSLLQVFGAKITDHYQNRKRVVMFFVALQAITLIPLFLIPFFTKSILILTLLFSLYLICANLAAPAWNSWIGEVVSSNDRAEYFSKRNKVVITSMVFSIFLAGLILNYFSTINIWIGFGILFGIALIGRIVSFISLTKHFEPDYVAHKAPVRFRDFVANLPKNDFGMFVIFRSLFAFAVMIASPFFAVYMLSYLNFSYAHYMTIVLTSLVIKVLTMTYWGKYAGKMGNRNIMYVSVFPAAAVPLFWLAAGLFYEGHSSVFFAIMIAEAISGFGWAGFELANFNYMLETSKPEQRTTMFAYYNIFFGTLVLLGGLLGSFILKQNYFVIGLKAIFIVFLLSGILRFVVILMFIKKIREVKINKDIDEGKLFLDLVVNKPLGSASNQTNTAMTFVEKNIRKIHHHTKKTVNAITKPIQPMVNDVVGAMDKGLNTADRIKKRIVPKRLRDRKNYFKKELVTHYKKHSLIKHRK